MIADKPITTEPVTPEPPACNTDSKPRAPAAPPVSAGELAALRQRMTMRNGSTGVGGTQSEGGQPIETAEAAVMQSALSEMCRNGYEDELNLFLNDSRNLPLLNVKAKADGATALMTAAEAGQLGSVRIILDKASGERRSESGLDLDAQDMGGHTSLWAAGG